ncbi:MAG TPA: FG-GAP-like repeat-containing protein [Pyrinomonadaceae bacterium]|nr:FG-GAP-like repeat-containing protein [Pyrinomonadaceae bacterium]
MKRFNSPWLLAHWIFLLTTIWIFDSSSAQRPTPTPAPNTREEAYRANNVGVALLEQFKHKEAADTFRRALQLEPGLALARINLGIALFNVPDLPAAQKELQSVIAANPATPQPLYVLGLIAKMQNRTDDAVAAFQRVLKIDPNDVGTNVNLGQIYAQQRKYPEAIAALRIALAAETYNTTALYNLGTALLRAGQRAEGQKVINQFQELRQRGSGTTLGNNYLEQGRYAEAIVSTGAEPELVDRTDPDVTFTDATAILGVTDPTTEFGRGVTLFDFDLDGDLDIFKFHSPQRLYRNDGGNFSDITDQSGALTEQSTVANIGAVAGDYDNDGRPDLFVLRYGRLLLYHNDGAGKFSDVSSAAGLLPHPYVASSTAFVDFDHDGDLDLFIANISEFPKPGEMPRIGLTLSGAPNSLLRNDGNGKFSNVTASAKLDRIGRSLAVIPTDFNNRRDIDLLVINHEGPVELFSNQRDGTFRDVAMESGLKDERWACAAAGDVNKDGYTDFFFGNVNEPSILAISDGREKFKRTAAPSGSLGVSAVQFFDYDNDGLLDCLANTTEGLRIWRNLGDSWKDVSERTLSGNISKVGLLALADIDKDGDQDLLLEAENGLRVARNDGGNKNHSLRVNLAGKVSNRSGVGAKIEIRAGSLTQKLETYSAYPAPAPADVIFGLGKRKAPDVVRVLWPAGIVQAETPSAGQSLALTLSVTELDRKPSSCPYLYVWNGEYFEFVTDFMGGGEMGHLEAPKVFNTPDPDEYVRIRGDQLKERNGRYEIRVTNELEEAVFFDRVELVAVDHPQVVEVYPNEGLIAPPLPPFKLHATRAARAPVSAIDDHGHDVLERITYLDRKYPDDFRLQNVRGYADEHSLTLKLREENFKDERRKSNAQERIVLLLTGWTDYAWSSDNLAASQSGRSLSPPALQVRDTKGQWRTVIQNIGIPVGRPQTVPVDLTGKFLSANREVRIVTNMRIYWDQILVDTSSGNFPVQMKRLDAAVADLRWRGFSREFSADGREPFGYDYEQASLNSPWKVMTGRYTREGDVLELLLKSDDMFVISRPGDVISLSFDADALPAMPRGWSRTFLLYADGFSKEMDINSASPDQVGPLPFHGMSKYPYTWPEQYPLTEQRRRYLEKYNTRVVNSPVPLIETEIISQFSPR